MKKKLATTMMVVLAVALLAGALAPPALAQGKGVAEGEGSLPPELQESQGEVQEALATLQEPMERIRTLAAELKEGRGAVVSALREKARAPPGSSPRNCAPT